MPTFPSSGPASSSGTSTLLSLIPEAAGHAFMGGPIAFYSGTVSSGSDTSTIYDVNLSDSSGAQTYKGWRAYFPASTSSRFVQDVDLLTGKLILNRVLASAPSLSSTFYLMRDFPWSNWTTFFNDALKQMKRKVTYLQTSGVTGRKISLPTGIDPDTVLDVRIREAGDTADPGNYSLPWYGFDYVSEVPILRSDRDLQGYDLLWDVTEPFATAETTTFTTDASTTSAPRDWVIAEAVSMALATLWSNQVTDADIRRVERRLAAAGRLVAGLRAKYTPSTGKRFMSSNPT